MAFELKGVSGVGTALKTGYDIVTGCQHIDDFAFAFVAPLET